MDEKNQGNPGHSLAVPDHAVLMPAAPDPIPAGVEVIKPSAEYEAELAQSYRKLAQDGMKHLVGPQPAQANIPAIEPTQAQPTPVPPPETAAEIKRKRGRPIGWRKPQGGEAHHARGHKETPRAGTDLARERSKRENAPPSKAADLDAASEGEAGRIQEAKPQADSSSAPPALAAVTDTITRTLDKYLPTQRDKEIRAAAVTLLRKLESLSNEWSQRIDALRMERRMRDDQIVLMLLARSIESPDYLETPVDHPYFADNFTPAGTPFHCVICGQVQSMQYPGQRPLCIDGTNVCANRFNSLSTEDQQELLSEVA